MQAVAWVGSVRRHTRRRPKRRQAEAWELPNREGKQGGMANRKGQPA